MAKSTFKLAPQLAADTVSIGNFKLCQVLLMNDKHYPWLVLVPRRVDVTEVYELSKKDQAAMWREVATAGQQLMAAVGGHKLNIASLGNAVPQLHVHIIARFKQDAAWPAPVWGKRPAQPIDSKELRARRTTLRRLLDLQK